MPHLQINFCRSSKSNTFPYFKFESKAGLKKSFLILLHAFFWIVLIILILAIIGITYRASTVNQGESFNFIGALLGVFIVPAAFSFYTFYTLLFNRHLKERKVKKAIIYGIILVFIASVLGNLTLYFTMDFTIECQKESNFISTPIMMFVGTVFGSIALVFKGFLTWYKEIKMKEELREKNYRTEIALVKSQLDPHFLFNTINNIDVLILKDPEEASNYLNKLSDIMRFMLFDTKTEKIPLQNELSYIDKYIKLQKIRTSNANYVSYLVKGNPEGKSIAPMIFIPFIENAFKHSDNKKIENAISIQINIQTDSVVLDCINKYSPYKEKREDSFGLGNELIKKRLNLIYPNSHSLSIVRKKDEYHVNLTIFNEEV